MYFLLFLTTFLSVSIATTLPQGWTEPNPASLFDLRKSAFINSIPFTELESPAIFDLHSQGNLGNDLTSFSLIGAGSIPSVPLLSDANDLISSNLISTTQLPFCRTTAQANLAIWPSLGSKKPRTQTAMKNHLSPRAFPARCALFIILEPQRNGSGISGLDSSAEICTTY